MKTKELILFISFIIFSLMAIANEEQEADFHFTENKGQFDDETKYLCMLHIGEIRFNDNSFTFDLFSAKELDAFYEARHHHGSKGPHVPAPEFLTRHIYKMNFLGANSNNIINTSDKKDSYKNYFRGNDPSNWASNVQSYKKISYQNIYDGIDINIYSTENHLKYDYIVAPGANVNEIKVQYEGVKSLKLVDGVLEVILTNEVVKELKPVAYQYIDYQKVEVPCEFVIQNNVVRFNFPVGYDNTKELIIDPTLVFASLTNSNSDNWGFTATYDDNANFYSGSIVLGNGFGPNFGSTATYPTSVGAYQTSFSDFVDVAITKFAANGATLIYSTYLGGNQMEEPHSLICDDQNNLIIMGATSSTNFPVLNAYQPGFGGGSFLGSLDGINWNNGADIFITKLNAAGSALIGSTYLGGSSNDGLSLDAQLNFNYADHARGEVILDANNDIYIASSSISGNYPTTAGAHSQALFGGYDGVVSKLSANLSTLIWSTFIGGASGDAAYSIRIDEVNNKTFICGGTENAGLATAGAMKTTYDGNVDGYVAKFDNSNGSLDALTYIGTTSYDQSYIVELDQYQDVYVVGQTKGTYPVSAGVYSNAGSTQFIHKMGNNLATSDFSTVFGSGSSTVNISITAFLVDNCDNIYVSGWGGSTNNEGSTNGMPITGNALQSSTDGSDFYFIVLDRDAQNLLYGTYYGSPFAAEHADGGTSRFDKKGTIYQGVCAACGGGNNFPTSPGAYSSVNGSTNCNYGAIKIDMDFQGIVANAIPPPNQILCGSPYNVTFSAGTPAPPNNYWDFGDASGTDTDNNNPLYTYADTGTYNVMYVAIDSSTCNIADTVYFNVTVLQNDSLSATFLFPPYDPCTDSLTIQLDFTGSGADSLFWDMGNGTTFINDTSITYTYTTQGSYEVTLEAYDLLCNNTFTLTDSVLFNPIITTINATAPPNIFLCSAPYLVNFNGNTPGTPNSYWDFGDASGTSILPNPTYTYADTGSYNVMYVAIDSSTCNIADTVYFNVTVELNDSLNATFLFPPYDPCTDSLTIQLDFTGSGADSLYWDMGNGTTFINDTSITYTYVTPGTWVVTLEAYDLLCSNTFTLTDTVFFNPVVTTVNATVPPNIFLCSAPYLVNFNGNTPGTPNSYWDFGDASGTSILPNPTYTYADTGSYNVMYVAIDSTTCNIADTVFFNVIVELNDSLDATFLFPPYDQCTDSLTIQLDFTGSGADSLYWDMGNGTTFINDTSVTYTYVTPGTWVVTLEAYDLLCNNTFTLTDTVFFNPTNTTVNAVIPPNIFLCSAPYLVNFTGNTPSTPYTYWDFGDGLGTSTLFNPAYTYADTGSYNVMYVAIDSTTCNIADTVFFNVTVELNDSLAATFSFPAYDPCTDSLTVQLNFTGSGADSLYWNMGNGTTFIDSNSVTYTYVNPGTFIVNLEAYDLVCNNSYTLTDTVFFTPNTTTVNAVIPPNILLCSSPYAVNFIGNTPSAPNSYWDFGDGGTSTQANPSYIYASSGNYNVMYVAIDSASCNISDTNYFNVNLQIAPPFSGTINFVPPPPCSTDSFIIDLVFTGVGQDSLVWDLGDGNQIINNSLTSYLYTDPGTYMVTMTAYNFLCNIVEIVQNEVTFTEFQGTESIIPNVFTPNGDGVNDKLQFVGIDNTQEYSIQIFNRWGNKVYEGTDALAHWDGGGHEEGAYFYILRYTDVCSSEELMTKGYVSLLK